MLPETSAIIEAERKIFHDINRLNEFMSTKSALQRILEALLQIKARDKHSQEAREGKQMKLWLLKYNIGLRAQTNKKDSNQYISFNNFKHEWPQLTSQNTQVSWWIKKLNPSFCFLQETHLIFKDRHHLRLKGWKTVFQTKWDQETSRCCYPNIWQNKLQTWSNQKKR